MSKIVLCRHCQCNKVNRPRGLCWHCYYTPAVSILYPSLSKFAPKNYRDLRSTRPLPPEATTALPGTAAKVAVLEARAEGRFRLWHPGDATGGKDSPPVVAVVEEEDEE